MVHTAVGFKGNLAQDSEARRLAEVMPLFKVVGPTAWAPTLVPGERKILVASGQASCCGVLDTATEETVSFDVNPNAADRYDLLVGKWRWTDPVTVPAFGVIKGTPGAGLPLAQVARIPGSAFDGVIAAVKVRQNVGAFIASDLVDLRVWGGVAAPFTTPQDTLLEAIAGRSGQRLRALLTAADYEHDGTTWNLTTGVLTPAFATGWAGSARYGKVGRLVTVQGSVTYSGSQTGTNVPKAFVLPAGFRPAVAAVFTAYTAGNGSGSDTGVTVASINTAGELSVKVTTSSGDVGTAHVAISFFVPA